MLRVSNNNKNNKNNKDKNTKNKKKNKKKDKKKDNKSNDENNNIINNTRLPHRLGVAVLAEGVQRGQRGQLVRGQGPAVIPARTEPTRCARRWIRQWCIISFGPALQDNRPAVMPVSSERKRCARRC